MIASTAIALKELLHFYSPGNVRVKLTSTKKDSIPHVELMLDRTDFVFVPDVVPFVMEDFALCGKVPDSFANHETLAKSWTVVRSTALDSKGETMFEKGKMPALGLPIVVNYEGRSKPSVGFMALHEIEENRSELVFMEYSEDQDFPIYAVAMTARKRIPNTDTRVKTTACRFIPQVVDGVIGWNYLSLDGVWLVDHSADKEIELFADCEFESETKTLLSVGLVNPEGQCYYAYDQLAADSVKDKWVRENVVPLLNSVPAKTEVTELNGQQKSFYDWLGSVVQKEQEKLKIKDANIRIRVDYSTDVAYLADLFHRLTENGIERFGKFRRVTFQIDYVDSYPTNLKAAVRHNAAWDAAAMWHHLGYHKKRILDRLMNSEHLGDALATIHQANTKHKE